MVTYLHPLGNIAARELAVWTHGLGGVWPSYWEVLVSKVDSMVSSMGPNSET